MFVCVFAFHRTPGCKLSCRLHMKAEDSGYTRRRGERGEKLSGRRRRRASAFILNPAGESLGLSLWERQPAAAHTLTHTHTQAHYLGKNTEYLRVPLKLSGTLISLVFAIIKIYLHYLDNNLRKSSCCKVKFPMRPKSSFQHEGLSTFLLSFQKRPT